jgi:hypothetical protein
MHHTSSATADGHDSLTVMSETQDGRHIVEKRMLTERNVNNCGKYISTIGKLTRECVCEHIYIHEVRSPVVRSQLRRVASFVREWHRQQQIIRRADVLIYT